MKLVSVREVDGRGKVVLPSEILQQWGVKAGDALEVSREGDAIVLQQTPHCALCGASDGLVAVLDGHACGECIAAIERLRGDKNAN